MGSLHDLIQFIFAGLTGGAIYALVALGFGVVHNTMGIVNFTQVDFVSLGGMILYTSLVSVGLPMAPALITAIAGVTLLALLVEVVGIRPSRSESHLVLIFLTIGLSIILRGAMTVIWGKNRMAVPPLSGETPLHLAGAAILPQTLWILALTTLAIIGLVVFFRKTSWVWPCGGWPPTPMPRRWWASRCGGSRPRASAWPVPWGAWPAVW
jgi:branched-chain amino acid transport system permease protein